MALAVFAAADDKTEKVDANKLVGKWEPDKNQKDKKMVVLEFTKDGKFHIRTEKKEGELEGTYTLDGNKLALDSKLGDKLGRRDELTILKLTDTELVMERTVSPETKKPESFTRIKEK